MAKTTTRNSYELGLGLTAEHRALADSVRAFTDRHIKADDVRTAVEAPVEQKLPPFWDALVQQDLLGLHIPERFGGSGVGILTLAVALEALTRRISPGPFVPSVLASALIAASESKAQIELLPKLVDGSATAAVAIPGQHTQFSAVKTADGYVVGGTADAVVGGENADVVVFPADIDGQIAWLVAPGDKFSRAAQDSIDVLRASAKLIARDMTVSVENQLQGLTRAHAQSICSVILGAEAIGLMSWCVSTAANYAQTRVQFGRPIGQFQGVKHKCAMMGVALEKARAVIWDAASALDKGDATAIFAADIAAAIVPESAVQVAQDCIQIHGGIGFTWEHDAHLYYRRALAIRAVLGSQEQRLERVAEQALDGIVRGCDIELPDEAEQIRQRVRPELDAIAAITDEDDQLIALGDGGWVQPHLPKPFGRGAKPLEQIVIAQEIAAAGIAMPQLLMGGWAVQAVVAHGTEKQKQELAVPTLRGDLVWCQLFSEPGAGSDLASLTTKAVKVDGGWKINGQKIWTTVAQFSDWAMLIARTDPAQPKHQGITYFVLDMSTPGVTVRPLREMTGSALFNEVFLDDVFIPDEHVVGEVNDGWNVARTTLAGERVALSQKMEAYATDKDLLAFAQGRELGAYARLQVGQLIAESQAVDLIGSRVVLQQLSGADVSTTSSVGKLLGMALGQAISEFVVAELGPAGTVSIPGQPSDKAMEQLIAGRATTIYGGTTEVQLNVIGERMLGLPRDAEPAGAEKAGAEKAGAEKVRESV
ncbi:acyl-CoA dehydrogenase [Hoyosella rhizosphaerae]|uniref:Acyl-CoA dehydrogenase FadE n=1 Tax=Hoyosella rhizosphaerae TaxID=1755582 RepID=A0A916U9F0_9ACTN|nr:acyl-CoA dehydrogenase [Hoyosella rhizosphaerae]MBN4926116.1 acyl-CoA dehydrogenase [Hoyosella rhizosphaerae]GGC65468.1 putative acyl-CoA dehydrogenase FadE [Hoyosella rhizosphaerae]